MRKCFRWFGMFAPLATGAAPLSAQELAYHVLVSVPGTAILVADDVEGEPDAREVTTLTVLGEASRGMDNEFNYWMVDCAARALIDEGGTAFLGPVKVGNIRSTTPDGPVDGANGTLLGMIADYACGSGRASADPARLEGDVAAVAYGKKLAGK